jgi:hypothetical protein
VGACTNFQPLVKFLQLPTWISSGSEKVRRDSCGSTRLVFLATKDGETFEDVEIFV